MQIKSKKFNFEKLVRSHGWCYLAPFEWSEEGHTLIRPLRTNRGKVILARISVTDSSRSSRINVITEKRSTLSNSAKNQIKMQVKRMLCLSEDFSPFHQLCRNEPLLHFVYEKRCGGLLRSPTAFEDLIKTVCTTNCDWRNTKKMCMQLCSLAGGAFPEPEHILKFKPSSLAKKVSSGYRTTTIHTIAKLTAEGKLLLDEWAEQKDFETIKTELKEIKGVGPYTISHILVLLGCYEQIPVDSEVLKYLRKTHFGGKDVHPKEAVKPYEKYGKYRYLAYKFGRMSRKLNYINK